jgi:hypothetical protein
MVVAAAATGMMLAPTTAFEHMMMMGCVECRAD